MSYQNRIITDPNVLRGKAVIKDTRISVEVILSKLSQGASHADLLRSYPRLRQEDIYAVLAYASARIANEEELSLSISAGS
ncbi:MAG: DUF433 domain-containing protein [Tunicatimonas sp.]